MRRPLLGFWLRTAAATIAATLATISVFALFAPVPAGEIALAWWTSRATGLLAYLALTVAMSLGTMVSWRGLTGALEQRRIYRLHDALALVSVLATVAHIVAVLVIVVAREGEVGIVAPIPATLGTAGTLALAGVYLTRWFTRRMSPARWRLVHRGAYVAFLLALGHAGTAGPGLIGSGVRWLYIMLGMLVAGAGLFRLMFRQHAETTTARAATPGESATRDEGIDEATGLPGRDAFIARVDQALTVARSRGEQVAFLYIDIDPFSMVTGPEAGVAREATAAAKRLASAKRSRDIVGRLSDQSFGLARRGRDVDGELDAIAAEIRGAIEDPAGPTARSIGGVSVGASSYPTDGWRAEGLIKSATIAMYRDQIANLQARELHAG